MSVEERLYLGGSPACPIVEVMFSAWLAEARDEVIAVFDAGEMNALNGVVLLNAVLNGGNDAFVVAVELLDKDDT